jgi:hypothetical protein
LSCAASADQSSQAILDSALTHCEQIDDKIAKEFGMLARHERRPALPEAEHDYIHSWCRGEVPSMKTMHDCCIKPGLKQYRDQCRARLADEAFGGLTLDDEVRVQGWAGCTSDSIDDRSSRAKRNIGEHIVWPAGKLEVDNIGTAYAQRGDTVESLVETRHECEIFLHGDDSAAVADEPVGNQAGTGTEIEDEVP